MTCLLEPRRPLPSLVAVVFGDLTTDLMDHVHGLGYDDLQLTHFMNVLRFVSEDGVRPAHIARQCGLTQQAVSLAVSDLEKRGYVARHPDPTDRRAQVVVWADRGRAAALVAEAWFQDLEQAWRAEVGDAAVDGALTTLAAAIRLREKR